MEVSCEHWIQQRRGSSGPTQSKGVACNSPSGCHVALLVWDSPDDWHRTRTGKALRAWPANLQVPVFMTHLASDCPKSPSL